MKTIKIPTLLCLLLGFQANSNAQILQNTSFENWEIRPINQIYNDTFPDLWHGNFHIEKTTDSYQGNFAVAIPVNMSCGVFNVLVNGEYKGYDAHQFSVNLKGAGTPISVKPTEFAGYYKNTLFLAGDSAEVTVILKKYNTSTSKCDIVGYGKKTLVNVLSYTPFNVPIYDSLPNQNPDSVIIYFNPLKNYFQANNLNSYSNKLLVDNVALTTTNTATGVSKIKSDEQYSAYVYPNPLSNDSKLQLKISFEITKGVKIKIIDAIGKEFFDSEIVSDNQVILPKNLSPGICFESAASNKH